MNSEPVHAVNSEEVDFDKEPFTEPSPKLDRMIESVRALEQWYAADFERRITSISELLKTQITEELRSRFSSELSLQTERIRKQHEERLYMQASQWQSQREQLEREIEELKRKLPSNDVLSEISAVEEAMTQNSSELERLLPDAASLGSLLQKKFEELERKAYLRGLKFQAATKI